jgi:4-hydroxy-tetrahydrodipicolinate synthase
MAIFEGAGVAIITPFHTDGSIDYDKFGEVIEQQIANQTDAIIVCGTTGESATMTHEEHLDVIRYCVEKVAHRIPVVAGRRRFIFHRKRRRSVQTGCLL